MLSHLLFNVNVLCVCSSASLLRSCMYAATWAEQPGLQLSLSCAEGPIAVISHFRSHAGGMSSYPLMPSGARLLLHQLCKSADLCSCSRKCLLVGSVGCDHASDSWHVYGLSWWFTALAPGPPHADVALADGPAAVALVGLSCCRGLLGLCSLAVTRYRRTEREARGLQTPDGTVVSWQCC